MKANIIVICLCILSFNAMAQKITHTTWEDLKQVMSQSEYLKLENLVNGTSSFTSLYQDGSTDDNLDDSGSKIQIFIVEGYFSTDIIKNNLELSKETDTIQAIVINLSGNSKEDNVFFDLALFKELRYIVISSYKESDVIEIQSDFDKQNQGKGREIIIIGNVLQQN